MAVDINQIIAQWDSFGVFTVFLPLLLVFAIVFGILTSVSFLGKNKGVHVIISIVVALLSIRLPLFSDFVVQAFPRFGVGLSIILMILILVGMFIPETDNRLWGRILMGVGAIIVVTILVKSSSALQWVGGIPADNFVPWLILAILVIGVIIAIAAATQDPKKTATDDDKSKWKIEKV